jgi:hypothetical protein
MHHPLSLAPHGLHCHAAVNQQPGTVRMADAGVLDLLHTTLEPYQRRGYVSWRDSLYRGQNYILQFFK